MSDNSRPLADAEREILKCPRCGQCRAVCPVFAERKDESSVARGRISLAKAMLDESFPVNREGENCISECTLCLACAANCPSGVETEKIFLAARAELADQLGISTIKRAAFHMLSRRQSLLPGLTFVASTFQDIPFSRLPEDSGLRLRFPVPGFDREHVLPTIARRPLRSQLPRQAGEGKRGTVAYFVGCYDNYMDTKAGRAAVSVLLHNGFSVSIPDGQGCCAMPMLASGVREAALPLMRRNVDAFFGSDVVLTVCASCGSALKHLYQQVFTAVGDAEYAEKAAALGERVKDLTQYLAEQGLRKPENELRVRVTFHDPCHLVRGLKVKAQPREALRSIPGLEFVEMKEADRCCGGGGSFAFSHYELAKRIGDRKAANIAASEAEVVATECPGCKLQLTDSLVRQQMPQRVRQVAELLAQAYGPIEIKSR